ncbi:MAG: DUF3299 domain-containing protein [Pseudomonadota bacterium]|nr:DUF3299 domain-containing protein [Pseudomonadota bacterium]
MKQTFFGLLMALLLATPALSADYKVGDRLPEGATAKSTYKTTDWDDLLPKDWNPMAAFKGIDLAKLQDSDPRAGEALAQMRKAWDAAPINQAMDGQTIRIPGFVVSLDGGPNELREFLLVPYFGACIHVPPPPANQIIHVMPDKPVKGVKNMEAVWVSGKLTIGRADTPMGSSGYRMQAKEVVRYKER